MSGASLTGIASIAAFKEQGSTIEIEVLRITDYGLRIADCGFPRPPGQALKQIRRFEDLEAWQTSRLLTRRIHTITKIDAFSRDFALKDQIRRASVSVMSNIAEGFESRTTRLFIDFLGRAKASAGEVSSQLYVALDQGYIDQATCDDLQSVADSLARQIRKFSQYLQSASDTYGVRETEVAHGTDDVD